MKFKKGAAEQEDIPLRARSKTSNIKGGDEQKNLKNQNAARIERSK